MNKILRIIYDIILLLLLGAATPSVAQTITGNIYGGGELAQVEGSTNVTINDGKLGANVFGGGEGKLNEDDGNVIGSANVSDDAHVTINGGEFAVEYDTESSAYIKPFKQHYNIYGGGYLASEVGNTHVLVTKGMIGTDSDGNGRFLENSNDQGIAQAYYHEGQMYFCVFGGGYGKHTSVMGNTWVDFCIGKGEGIEDINSTAIEDDLLPYQSYLDVIGGGFNGKIMGNTNVHIGGNAMCRNVYGGGLYATIGTQDDAEKGKTNVHITGGNIDNVYGGGVMGDILTSTNVTIGLHDSLNFDGRDYAPDNERVTILMSVFGGNDVSGRVETANVYHYGGEIDQDIYGAGNGNYRGYYTPGVCDFADGDNENYYPVDHSGDTGLDGITKGPKGNTYKGRPQTGNVNITIAGNSTADKAIVLGQVFGGGNSCTVGNWDAELLNDSKYNGDPHLVRDDPAYFLGGGSVNVTIGSHVKIGRSHKELVDAEDEEYFNKEGENVSGLFMGCSGKYLATQETAKDDYFYHHYYDAKTAKYWPGFAVFADDGTPLSREEGLASFNAYLNNILVWSDSVQLSIADDVEDVWMSNFVGGGFRGSMKAQSAAGQFHYALPRGVTIGHDIVGGAYNTDVVYRVFDTESDMHTYKEKDGHYLYRTDKAEWSEGDDYHHIEYAEDDTTITGIIRFYYDGGMLSHDNVGSRRKGVFTAYGSGDDNVIDFSGYTSADGLRKHKDKALVYVDARCQLDPEVVDGHVRGGNVFGGCFNSGTVDGDVWTDYRCYIANKWYGDENFNGGPKMFANAADYQHNFAMMAFGAGYGKNTSIKGDTYLRVIYNKENSEATYPCLYNVFGGSFQGTVDGNTNIYYNAGQQGLTVGGIYGGGSQGYVAGKSFVELAGGYIANVYGGAREANVGKGTHVWAYDGALRNWADDLTEHDDAPLVVERMFGGSDVSGLIGFKDDAADISNKSDRVDDSGWTAHFSTSNWPEELFVNGINDSEGLKKFDSYIQVGGTDHSTRGYPLIGEIYAGGNGENTDTEHGHILPGINTALIELNDGNVMEAFGGGNAATVHEQNYILVAGKNKPVSVITMPNPLLTQILKERVLKSVPDCYTLSGNTFTFQPRNVQRLFGGNNQATMAIQPKWNLKSGYLGCVYSGGNMGDMTYFNPDGRTLGHENESKGLSIDIYSDDIHIESLYGGCRMSNVRAMNGETPAKTFDEDDYGATVNVRSGHIGNIYGGNDVSGYVYNGTNVNLSGSVTGNVYGAGNGNYLYAYDKTSEQKHVGDKAIVQEWNEKYKDNVYWIPGTADATPLQQLLALNNARPHVEKAYLNIVGESDTKKVYIYGSVYCGGNASTIRPMTDSEHEAHVKFNIGNNVIVNNVFMGSNGDSLKYDATHSNTYLENFEEINGLILATDLSSTDWSVLTNENTSLGDRELVSMDGKLRNSIYPNLLSVYMRAVDMKAMPQGFTSDFSGKTFENTWIGTFCMGGNAGSMMVDQPVDIIFPQSLNFFGRIIGGSKDASFQYKGLWHRGGFRMPLAVGAMLDAAPTKTKLRMKIRSDWYSRRMVVDEEDTYKDKDYLAIDKTDDGKTWKEDGKAWSDGCNVYGGCYQSGDMVGDLEIYIESDMLAYSRYLHDTPNATIDDYHEPSLDESNKLNLPVANVYGAGYGPESRSFGDAYIYMKDIPNAEGWIHPSVNNIFGGGRNGVLIGNSVIHVHDGLVYKDVVGGSFAAAMYGSAQVTVGYPKFYVCKKTGEYFLDRADRWNEGYKTKGYKGDELVVKKSIKYFEGTYVPCNVYDKITGVKLAKTGDAVDLSSATFHPVTRAANEFFDYHDESVDASFFPLNGWDDVEIRVRGGVYGGGYSLSNSTSAVAGSYTTLASTETYNHGVDSEGNSSVGYGGNSSVIISDFVGEIPAGQEKKDHIKISTENPVVNNVYSGTGGIYGDGRLVFCEGFRTAELNGYGYAGSSISEPLMLNSMQRLDLLTINDCCFKLYGDQDFATDQYDARKYSLARIGELSMNSSLTQSGNLPADKRNYIAFFNNIHYLGSIITNDDFRTALFHDHQGNVESQTYYDKKQKYIADWYASDKQTAAENTFKQRNYATARNMVGINSGFCLRVENQYYEGEAKQTYYGPIVGVCEMKLLNVQPGEGGGYVYADNVHADIYDPNNPLTPTFMNESGNFVFPSMVRPGEGESQYIVDDCLPQSFDEATAGRAMHSDLPEQHYWYVIGDTYYYNATLTAYSYKTRKDFDLTTSDPNVIFAGIEEGCNVSLESVQWQYPDSADHVSHGYPAGYEGDIRGKRDDQLTALAGSSDKYKFTLQIGNGDTWSQEMLRSTTDAEQIVGSAPSGIYQAADGKVLPSSPQFNVHLIDNVNNCPEDQEEEYYNNHLSVPERVLLKIKSSKAGQPTKTYNVTLDIVYIQGPSFTGEVTLRNCALPGEKIEFSSDGIEIKTTDQLPLTGFAWKLVPITREELVDGNMVYEWSATDAKAEVIPESAYTMDLNGSVDGTIPALYNHNHWNVFFTFTAAGETFTVEPTKNQAKDLSERMLVVHNYHRMKDVTEQGIEESVVAGARIYIKDVEDLKAFQTWVNAGKTTGGVDFILQESLTLPDAWEITKPFEGALHGDGYVLEFNRGTVEHSLFGSQLMGKVYNLGMVGGTISSVDAKNDTTGLVNGDHVINSYEYDTANFYFKYGKNAYDLSHYFTPTTEGGAAIATEDGYVYNYFANGDYQYARHTDAWSLRTAESPNYGSTKTYHDTRHTHDAKRWSETDGINIPLHDGREDAYNNDYLYFGQHLDKEDADAYPVHINRVANGDADFTKGGNRVYGTKAYYNESVGKAHDYIHFNADAWAFQPTEGLVNSGLIKHEEVLTSIDFTQRTSYQYKVTTRDVSCRETDGCPVSLVAFHVDSNADYDAAGNDRGSAAYTNRGYMHVTQNLLVVHDEEDPCKDVFAEGHYVNDTPEEDIRYHAFTKESTDLYTTPYFHLVDNQDFFAAIAKEHRITERAWYERQPLAYRNIPAAGYQSGSGWEGICLPFTVAKVTASGNGEITHFYDADSLHHEYWLRGLTGVTATTGGQTLATFQRPGLVSGFSSANQTAAKFDYDYKNTYFTTLDAYNDDYDTRDDEGDDQMGHHDKAWYAQGHTFSNYLPLTYETPYIIAFPGNDFYEFSMEGTVYDRSSHSRTGAAQMVTFDGKKNAADYVTFVNSQTDGKMKTEAGAWKHVGVFSHKQAKGKAVINSAVEGDDAVGSFFKDKDTAYPFRTYLDVPKSSSASTRAIWIADAGFSGEDVDDEAPEQPADELADDYLRIWAQGMTIVVETTRPRVLPVYTSDGIMRCRLQCEVGVSTFEMESIGVYFVGRQKLLLKKP